MQGDREVPLWVLEEMEEGTGRDGDIDQGAEQGQVSVKPAHAQFLCLQDVRAGNSPLTVFALPILQRGKTEASDGQMTESRSPGSWPELCPLHQDRSSGHSWPGVFPEGGQPRELRG